MNGWFTIEEYAAINVGDGGPDTALKYASMAASATLELSPDVRCAFNIERIWSIEPNLVNASPNWLFSTNEQGKGP